MAIRDKISAAVTPHLHPGENLQAVFFAQTHSQYLAGLGLIPFFALNRYRTVAVTDRRIAVFDSGALTTTKAKKLLTDIDRSSPIGPTSGLWHRWQAGPELLRVHKRFFKDIAAADAAGAAGAAGAQPTV